MFATKSDQANTISDRAARLTDLALEALAGTSIPRDSIEVELRLWHALEAELERDQLRQRSIARHGGVAREGDGLQLLSRAARRVIGATEQFSDKQGRRAERADRSFSHV